jgi:Tfp pilus assembly protein PilN
MNLSLNKLKIFSPYWTTLTRMGRPLGKILFLSPADETIAYKKILCPAIERGEISIAVGSKCLSRIKILGIKNYPSFEGDFPLPQFLASSLDLAVAELRADKYPLVLSIPKTWAVIKTVEYPATVMENLSEVISYELDRITPFTTESAYYDYRVLKQEEEQVFIVVAAARADLIDPYLKVIHEKGFKVEGLTINLLGSNTLCRYLRKSDRSLFAEIDKNHYQGALSLSESSLEVFSGSFVNEDEKTKVEQINAEIESLHPFLGQKEPGSEIIFNLKDKSPTLRELIKTQMRRPVSFLDESDFGFGPLGKERKQIPYTAIGGILESLWPKSWGMNLLTRGLRLKSNPPWVITLLLVLTLGGLVGIYWATPVEIETKRLHTIEKQITLKKAEVKKVEVLKKEIDLVFGEISLVNDFRQSKPLCLNILKELTALLPKNSWLTRVRVFESQVSIEGYSPSATLLIPKLDGSKLFKKVEFAAPTFKDPRQNMDRFQIKMELKNP